MPPRHRAARSQWFKDTRFRHAVVALCETITLGDLNDPKEFANYYSRSVQSIIDPAEVLKVILRWPRVRDSVRKRLRRRFCWGCGRQYDLSEPRLWVCSGCGDARYCDEAPAPIVAAFCWLCYCTASAQPLHSTLLVRACCLGGLRGIQPSLRCRSNACCELWRRARGCPGSAPGVGNLSG